ncbi:MAG: phytoene/squalene synthase family protein [Saprospirales bacterium]|nr:phytoene/squalene synthase family protein [Saprospirales bacterium]MBK8922160.1 phytoene/squalene synthase family protein [Saprospirales bacterium]
MNHVNVYHSACAECSRLITLWYSTSFSMGIRLFHRRFRAPVYAIYGFVRFADEIVDTFHQYPKRELLDRFREDTYRALEEGISLNPVLHSLQRVVRQYGIGRELIDAFLRSMEMDLDQNTYDPEGYNTYIYGSAEAVGLMCLRVFCEGDDTRYEDLKAPACRLGAAFQKINFLRDIKSDYDDRGRVYFPGVDFRYFDNADKKRIEADIHADFQAALDGIRRLPDGARFGVYLAYKYYTQLFVKIRRAPAQRISQERFRVSGKRKVYLLFSSALRHRLNLL